MTTPGIAPLFRVILLLASVRPSCGSVGVPTSSDLSPPSPPPPPPRRHRRRRRRRRRQSHRRRPRPRPTPSLTPSGHEHISINAPWLELGYVDSMYTQYRVYPRVLGGAAVPEGLAVALSSSQLEHLLSSSCVADTNQYLFNTESCSDICYYT